MTQAQPRFDFSIKRLLWTALWAAVTVAILLLSKPDKPLLLLGLTVAGVGGMFALGAIERLPTRTSLVVKLLAVIAALAVWIAVHSLS